MTIATSDSVDQLPLAAPREAPAPQQPLQRPQPTEPAWKRQLFLVLAVILTAGYGFFLFSFTAPAPGRFGIDENAYLVGGRNLAAHGTSGFKPGDDYQFVGAMWIRTASGWYYPKYGIGTSLLYAVTIFMHEPDWAFFISPACTALAVLGMFFLARPIVGSFYALLAMIVLAMGPTTLQLAILPDSHAPALCAVVWGMYFLLRWWQTGRWWLGVPAGLLLGFAVTIRYSEALLLFGLYSLDVVRIDQIGPKLHTVLKVIGFLPVGPLGIAVISRVKWTSWRSYLSTAAPAIAWTIPVAALVCFNRCTIGHFTGYDSTNESSGFSLDYFVDKWDFAVSQIYLRGLFLFAPLGVAGLVLMFRTNRRAALLFTLWFVPGTLLYTAYYWGGNAPSIAYLRFFLTLFPPLIIAGMYVLHSAQPRGKGSIVAPLAAAVLTASAAAIGLWGSIDELVRQHRGNMNMRYSAREVTSHIPRNLPGGRPMIIADSGMFPIFVQYMQYMYEADWYPSDIFAIRAGGGFGLAGVLEKRKSNDNTPVVLQQERMDYIDSMRKGKTDADFIRDAHHLMDQALDSHRKIFVVISPTDADGFRHRFITAGLEMVDVNRWSEPCNISYADVGTHDSLAPSVIGDSPILPWHPRRWAMFEIRRTPTTQPSIAVSSR